MSAYWDAGQKRVADDTRTRMRELYVTTRDAAISADVLVGRVKTKGDHVPAYVRPKKPPKGLAQLLADNPTSVTRAPPEFRN